MHFLTPANRRRRGKLPSKSIHFQLLGSDNAKAISSLQKRLFPADLTEPLSTIEQILKNTEKEMVCNLSFGLFDGHDLVGYFFVYIESESLFYGKPEEVVYLKEIALLPRYEKYLRPMFFKLFELWRTFTPGLPLEAHAVPDALQNWQRLKRVFRYFGMALAVADAKEESDSKDYRILRFDVASATVTLFDEPKPLPKPQHVLDGLSVTIISDTRQWLSLKDDWRRLLDETPDSNIFQSFDFLWSWWTYFGFENDLKIIVIRDGEKVIGVVPLMREYFSIFGRTVRKLLFITAPMEMSRPKLIFGENANVCMPAFLDYLREESQEWDIIDIDEQLSANDTSRLREFASAQHWLLAESETVCPYIELDSSWQDFRPKLSKKMRSNVNRIRKRIATLGKVELRTLSHWSTLEKGYEYYCGIEEDSWKAGAGLALSSDKSSYFFYRSLAKTFGQTGQFELRFLDCDGVPIAGTFGLSDGTAFQSMKIAHLDEHSRYSPGTVLESFEIEAMFETKLQRYEFMGSFLTNKLRWTSKVFRTENIHIYQRQPRLILFYFLYFVVKRRVAATLKKYGQFERAERLLKKFKAGPFPRY